MTTMVCRATDDLSSAWLVVARDENGVWGDEKNVTAFNTLEAAMKEVALAIDIAFTFTTRALADAIASYAETFEDLRAHGADAHTVIMCPEGPPVVNRWATLHRVPITGAMVGTGLDGRFRPQLLKDVVAAYFLKHQYRSFAAPRVHERFEPIGQQPHRPSHHRELLVRPSWSARQIAPEAFAPLNKSYYPKVA